jgi:hypothetical protein
MGSVYTECSAVLEICEPRQVRAATHKLPDKVRRDAKDAESLCYLC